MTDYFLAKSLVAFRNSVDAAYPNRSKASDGWIGDASHAARTSDHNPCWDCPSPYTGIVRAIDVTNDPAIPEIRDRVVASAIGHPAVWYVISNGKIYSRTHNWVANDYTGTNGHYHHVHISLNHDPRSYDDTSLILKAIKPQPPKGQVDDMPLNDTDLGKIEAIVQKYTLGGETYLRQLIDDIGNYTAAATEALAKDDFDTVKAQLSSLKSSVDALGTKAP